MKAKTPADKRIAQVLTATFPWIEVWETRGLDSLDVHAVDVESLRDLAAAAFAAGRDFETKRKAVRS